MLITYYSNGQQLFATIHGHERKQYNYTCGWLDDGTAESGIITLHGLILDGLLK